MGRALFLLLLVFYMPTAHLLDCSVDFNTTCDSVGNATLDTAVFYERYKNCDWSSKDKNDTVLEVLTPSLDIKVQCSLVEIRLKVHCISPKHVDLLFCYKFKSNDGSSRPKSAGEIHHRSQVAISVPVCLCLFCWMFLL